MASHHLVLLVVAIVASAPVLSFPTSLGVERNDSAPQAMPWPVLVDEANFRTLLIANSANDTQALRDVFVESFNTTLADLTATLNNRSVSDTSVEEALERAVNKLSRENGDAEDLERIREDRIHTIKYQILGFLGFTGGMPNLNSSDKEQMDAMRELYSQIREMPVWPPSDLYTEKVQSFYPSCVRPRNTDDEMWSDPDLMHLYFDLKYPEPIDGLMTDVITAKLRLHKIAKFQATSPCDGDDCNTVSPLPMLGADDGLTSPSYNSVDDIIRVSVYYYTRSLKKNKVKRKILDSRMLSSLDEEWTEFNVGAAAKSWMESGKNHGLVVQVEDQYGQLISARKYFSPMDCTKEASDARPIPGFLVASTNNIMQRNKHGITEHEKLPDISGAGQNNALYFNSFMFPMIDLCTAEIPRQDIADQALRHIEEDIALSSFPPQVNTTVRTSPDDVDEIEEINDDTPENRDNDTEHQPDDYHHGHRHHLPPPAQQGHSTRDSWTPEKPRYASHRGGNFRADLVMVADGTHIFTNEAEHLSGHNDVHDNDNEAKDVVFKEVAVSDDYVQGSSTALID